jgi:hypothetical protein
LPPIVTVRIQNAPKKGTHSRYRFRYSPVHLHTPPIFSNTSPRISHARGLVLDKLTIGSKIVLHLYDTRRHNEDRVSPIEMTQLGVSRVLGIRRNHAGIELNRLVLEGYVEVGSDWVRGEKGKRQVYKLTPAGRDLAEILAETSGIDLGAKSVNCEDAQLDWLMKMELLTNENRPKAPSGPPIHTQSPPE